MSLLNKINLIPFFFPTETETPAPIEDKSLSKEDVIELLGEDTPEEQETIELEKDTKKDDKTDEKEKDEKTEKSLEDEIEEELAEPSEEDLELAPTVSRKEILAKYPNIFKDFPQLQAAYYREQKYAEILPTIEDAQTAVDKAELLDNYEQGLMDGSTEGILKVVRDGDEEAFNRIVDNYLPALHKVDEGAYYHVLGNIIKHTIVSMVNEKDEALSAAAEVLNEFVFGTKQFTPAGRLSKGDSSKKDDKTAEIESREEQFIQRQFDSASGELTNRVTNILKSTVDKNIDPKDSMTEYVRKNATREAMEDLENLIEKDTRFKVVLDKLWEKAFTDGFNSNSMDRIKSAYLSKAKTLLPSVIKKARNEALKGLGKRIKDDDDEVVEKKGPLPVGQTRKSTSSSNSGKTDREKAKEIPRGVSTFDYLNSD
jgi:hypothetical protein